MGPNPPHTQPQVSTGAGTGNQNIPHLAQSRACAVIQEISSVFSLHCALLERNHLFMDLLCGSFMDPEQKTTTLSSTEGMKQVLKLDNCVLSAYG